MKHLRAAGLWLALATSIAGGSVAWAQAEPGAQDASAEQLVVTARRTGIPVWRVTGPRTSIVLIGSIEDVAKGTKWDPGALATTLRQADRVMFPGQVGVAVSPFSMIGYYVKFKRMATLPKGQSLAQMLTPAQYQRLVALKNRGVLKAGFERSHPLHLSIALRRGALGKGGFAPGVGRYVSQTVKKHKIKTVPIRMIKAKPLVKDFFATPPREYVPCLMASVALAEAGPEANRARSQAWAQRRVPDVLASPADRVYDVCVPPALEATARPDLQPQIRTLLTQPQLTVAVVGLRSLAEHGGVLDDLSAAGFQVSGPQWK